MADKTTLQERVARARAKAAELRAAGELVWLDPVQKAMAEPKSRTKAIKAMCYQCMGGGDTPNWRDEVRACKAIHCALHHVRPYR